MPEFRATDVDFAAWRVERSAPLVAVGMAALLAGGFVLLAVGLWRDTDFTLRFWPSVAITSPGFVVAIVATRRPGLRRHLDAIVAVVVAVWASTITWSAHQVLQDPGLGTISVILALMFGAQVFSLPRALLPPVALAPTALHLVLMQAAEVEPAAGAVVHVTLTVAVVVAGLIIGHVNERGERLRFEQSRIIAAQTRTIEAERVRSDALVRRMLPSSVADRMRAGEDRLIEHLDGVTVLFADLVGFTLMTRVLPAHEVVAILDAVFEWIDGRAVEHGVEKIKTIGDAYMAAVGAPDPHPDAAGVMAAFALDIRDGLPALSATLSRDLQMRIGIATGSVVAGVLGGSRLGYDLWSDSVNTAARLQALAGPGEIRIDHPTALALEDRYRLSRHDLLEVRGRGPTMTWVLDDRGGVPEVGSPPSPTDVAGGGRSPVAPDTSGLT